MDDAALLRRFADTGSEDAFAALVRQYLPLVYGAARRKLGGDVQLAEDVVQMVFTALSRDAARLARHPNLPGWLFTTTRYLAAKAVRGERRRQRREQEAARIQLADREDEEPGVEAFGPVLDDVVMELRELDRQMLLMRFYQGLRLVEIATRFNLSENAVQKRIERALDRLNAMLSRRGLTSTAAALALTLEHHAAVSVPAGLAAASTSAGLAASATGVAGAAAPAVAGSAKLTLYIAAAVAVAGSAGVAWYSRENSRLRAELARVPPAASMASAAAEPSPPTAGVPLEPSSVRDVPVAPVAPPSANTPTRARPPARPAPVNATAIAPPPSGSIQPTEMVPLVIEYPRPLFAGTPRPIQVRNLDANPAGKPRDLMVPAGTALLSRGKPVSSSDALPVIGELSFITDGDKTGTDGTYVELGPNSQWVQIDLGGPASIAAVVAWHFHAQARAYHDVVVQVSNDPAFSREVTTLFNNDDDSSSRLGRGHDPAYIETSHGRIFDGRGTVARYVRLYSNGNTSDELNHYCEVEVHGTPSG